MSIRRPSRPGLSATIGVVVDLFGPRSVPDLRFLRRLLGTSESKVAGVLEEMDDELATEQAIGRALRSTGRTYYAQFPAPVELFVITRILRPRQVVESGVSSGLSSAHLLMALRRNRRGRLHSIDLPQYQKADRRRRGELSWFIPKGRDSGWAVPRSLTSRWDLRQGSSEELLPRILHGIPSLDLFCHDSPWTPAHLAFEFEAIRHKLHSGSIVLADNADVNPQAVRDLARAFRTRVWHRRGSDLIGIRIP